MTYCHPLSPETADKDTCGGRKQSSRHNAPGPRHFLYPWKRHALCLLPTFLLVLCTWLACGSEDGVRQFWHNWAKHNPALREGLDAFGRISPFLLYAIFLCLLFRDWRRNDKNGMIFFLVFAAAQLFVALLLASFFKISFGRSRPYAPDGWNFFSMAYDSHSLPSGHTTDVTGAALPLAWRFNAAAPTVFLSLFMAFVAYSRIMIGKHHPTDILAGLALGSLTPILMRCLLRYRFPAVKQPSSMRSSHEPARN